MRATTLVQARLGQHAHVQRRHAHEQRRARQVLDHHARIELRQPDHLAAVEQRAVDGHEQAMHVEDRQRVDQHVAFFPAPVVLEHLRVGQQVAVREHRALAAPGGAAGVEDGGQVVRAPRHGHVPVAAMRGTLEQRAGAVVVQREHVAGAGLERDLADPAEVAGGAHDHGRLGVADEVFDLGALVGGVERQEDVAGAQRRQVQHHRFDRLVDLHRDARAFGDLQRREQVGDHGRRAVQVAPGIDQAIGRLDGRGVQVLRKRRAQRGKEVLVHGIGSSGQSLKRRVFSFPGRRRCLRGARRCRHSHRRRA